MMWSYNHNHFKETMKLVKKIILILLISSTLNPSVFSQNLTKKIDSLILKDTHYFKQPSLKGILMDDGTRAISQESVGGLRVVEIVDLQQMEEQAWQLGYLWMDYVSSWNDLETKKLEKNGWVLDYKSIVPWRLNPIQENYFCDVSFLSEQPIDKELIVKRSHSDHGRIGSIK